MNSIRRLIPLTAIVLALGGVVPAQAQQKPSAPSAASSALKGKVGKAVAAAMPATEDPFFDLYPLPTIRSLADRGNAKAQRVLGSFYANGEGGVPQDYAEAARWLHKAAEQGEVRAQYKLGYMYLLGEGVTLDDATAVSWFRKAADQGDPPAQNMLGTMYDDGVGVPQDYVLAHMWLNLAAATKSPIRAAASGHRIYVEARMTRDQIAEAQRLAREWKPK